MKKDRRSVYFDITQTTGLKSRTARRRVLEPQIVEGARAGRTTLINSVVNASHLQYSRFKAVETELQIRPLFKGKPSPTMTGDVTPGLDRIAVRMRVAGLRLTLRRQAIFEALPASEGCLDAGAHRHVCIEAENRFLGLPDNGGDNGGIEPPAVSRVRRIDKVVHRERVADDE